jgi:hypothetical protein
VFHKTTPSQLQKRNCENVTAKTYLRQRSQAWAMRLWELVPTLITFIGKMPGIVGGSFLNNSMQMAKLNEHTINTTARYYID